WEKIENQLRNPVSAYVAFKKSTNKADWVIATRKMSDGQWHAIAAESDPELGNKLASDELLPKGIVNVQGLNLKFELVDGIGERKLRLIEGDGSEYGLTKEPMKMDVVMEKLRGPAQEILKE